MDHFSLKDFWAKTLPFQSVQTHAIVSGHVAQILLDRFVSIGDKEILLDETGMDGESLRNFIGYFVSLHDIGKIDYSFQAKYDDSEFMERLREAVHCDVPVPNVRHEKTGKDCLKTLWRSREENREAVRLFPRIVGAHHQGKTGSGGFASYSESYSYQKELECMMRDHFLGSADKALPHLERKISGRMPALVLGITILADWISSGSFFADAEEWIDQDDAIQIIDDTASKFLSNSGLMPQHIDWPTSFCGLWPVIPLDGRRPLQRILDEVFSAEDHKPILVLLEAPMGEGKTEAGVYAGLQMARLWGKDGMYVAMPTSATANQMVGRIRALMKSHAIPSDVRLLHSMAWLDNTEEFFSGSPDERDEAAKWLAPLKRGLLGQYSVGTVDQAMFAATNVKYGALRLLGLSNKVLIIDEIHSYDAYMSEIIIRLLDWCRALRVPVVLMSATIPPFLKKKLLSPYTDYGFSGEYPSITMIDKEGKVTERHISETSHKLICDVQLLPYLGKTEQIAQAAIERVSQGGCLCVLMNTVREAQEVYQEICSRYDGDRLLFHARFPARRRIQIEQECIRRYGKDRSQRPTQSILVATQVVEQSLDVDFDGMITAVAPIDLLLQRMGRIHRHEGAKRPPGFEKASLTVLTPEDSQYGPNSFVYPVCMLQRSVRLLQDRDSIHIPEDLAGLVSDGYNPEIIPEEEIQAWLENQIKEQVQAGSATQYLLNSPDGFYHGIEDTVVLDDEEETYQLSVKTRLGEPTVRIAFLSKEQMGKVAPFFCEKNGETIANVCNKKIAEAVMLESVSVRMNELKGPDGALPGIKGTSLLSGLRILGAVDGRVMLENGKTLHADPEFGLRFEGR
ncbi:MAG: CRISPR-associated helicase Cas3' [Lachnospiraceae bacterium]|nr:CRISPR-associated helicase Cas3' [Lachnospiraceae bacterium]